MKRLLVVVFLLVSVLVGCDTREAGITGTWERISEDTYKGMQVEVVKLDDGSYRGIVKKSDNENNYKVGNLKWSDINSIKDNTDYDIIDLTSDGSDFYKMQMKFEGEKLILRNFVDQGEEGSSQEWVRVTE